MYIYLGLICTLAGIWISHKLYMGKRGKVKLACPREGGCDIVLHSTHSELFGVGNETWGLLYFSLVGLLLATLVLYISTTMLHLALFFTTGGILYSLYLVYIQVGILKKWCWWCVSVAGINFVLWSSVILCSIR